MKMPEFKKEVFKLTTLGFTLIELLAVIVILAIILAIAIPGISNVVTSATKASAESNAKMVLKAIEYKMMNDEAFNPTSVDETNVTALLNLSNNNYQSLTVKKMNDKLYVTIVGKNKWNNLTVSGTKKITKASDTVIDFVRGANAPKLVEGMKPIIWNEDSELWEEVDEDDPDWYNYDTINKRWANARTNDCTTPGDIETCSMWVWIPRYVYRISSGWHTYEGGKNKIDPSRLYNNSGFNLSTGNPMYFGTKTVPTYPIAVEPNTTYTLTRPVNSGNISVLYFDYYGNFLSSVPNIGVNVLSVSFTTPDDCYLFAFTDDANSLNEGYQLEEGDSATAYEAFLPAGTIDIQFTRGVDDNWNKSVIGAINLNEDASASNNTWTNHPAFTFGDIELTGIWVAKFEASVDQSDDCYTMPNVTNCQIATIPAKFVPNVSSWRYANVGTEFAAARNMETNEVYGWGLTGVGIDTHMMKNVEWGAVAYLSQSSYGKNAEIWVNPSDNFTTGCAGNSASSETTDDCLNFYDSPNGQQASTTGNIYGIYDMSGGAWEYLASYVDNGNDRLESAGSNILSEDAKYKDVYSMGTNDSYVNNYTTTKNHKGDAIYEISGSWIDDSAWYSDWSTVPNNDYPWLGRSGHYSHTTRAGIFSYSAYTGPAISYNSFRTTLLIDENL